MKKKYIKPTQQVIVLQHRTMLLCGSGTDDQSDNLDEYEGTLG